MTASMNASTGRASGSLFGLALGDALGAKTEFLGVRASHDAGTAAVGGRVVDLVR